MKSILRFTPLIMILSVLLTVGTPVKGKADYLVNPSMAGAFVPNEILIGLEPDFVRSYQTMAALDQSVKDSLSMLNRQFAVQEIEPLFPSLAVRDPVVAKYALAGIYKLTVPPGVDLFLMIEAYRDHPGVEYAELNNIFVGLETPNDTNFKEQWGLNNTGQDGGTPDADVDAPEAWNIEKGKAAVMR